MNIQIKTMLTTIKISVEFSLIPADNKNIKFSGQQITVAF